MWYNAIGNVAKVPEKLTKFVANPAHTVDSVYDLPPKLRHMADFASAAYNQTDRVRGYRRDPSLSTDEFNVYVSGDSVIFAIRGSKVARDFYESDAQIVAGLEPAQVTRARPVFAKVGQRYPNSKIALVGHSLGAATASWLADENPGTPGVFYNPGSAPSGSGRRFANPSTVTVIKEGDFVSASMIDAPENMYVIRKTDQTSLGAHGMDNFSYSEEAERISETLKDHPDRSAVMRALHEKGFTEAELKQKHEDLKGGADIALNIGPHAFSGGFHAEYTNARPQNMIDMDGHKVPGPGALIYVKDDGRMYAFSDSGDAIILDGTMDQRGELLKQAKGYDQGPTLLVRESNPSERVAMVAAVGGQGFDTVPVRNLDEYRYALGGLGKTGGAEWWSGKHHDKPVGNGAVNVFLEKPPQTIDDKTGDFVLSAGEFLLHNSWAILQEAVSTAINVASAGTLVPATEAAKAALGAVDDVVGLVAGEEGGFVQSQINKLAARRDQNLRNVDNIFSVAKTTTNSGFLDPKFVGRDDRIDFLQNVARTLEKDTGDYRPDLKLSGSESLNDLRRLVRLQTEAKGKIAAFKRAQKLADNRFGLELDIKDAFADGVSAKHYNESVDALERDVKKQEDRAKEALKGVVQQKGYYDDSTRLAIDKLASENRFRTFYRGEGSLPAEFERFQQEAFASAVGSSDLTGRKYDVSISRGDLARAKREVRADFLGVNIKNEIENPEISTEKIGR